MQLPPGHVWRTCPRLKHERACLRERIRPCLGHEIEIRPCDICPVGADRARALAQHVRWQNAVQLGLH
jgi:hypothetical protein